MGSRLAPLGVWLALGVTVTGGCADPAPERAPTTEAPVQVAESAPPRPTAPAPDRGYVGVVIAGESVDIAPKTSGELLMVYVRTGDKVEAGDRIATLDDRRAHEELEMTSAGLRSAQARLNQAKIAAREARRKYEESKALVDAGHAPRSTLQDADYERSRTNAAVSEAQAEVANLRTGLQQRERQLEETTLTAPFSGTIAERYADAGTVVAAGSRVARLISGDTLWVRVAVPPADIGRLQVGDIVLTEIETLETTLHATIRQVAPEVDSASRLVFVEAQLELPDNMRQGSQTGAAAWVRPLLDSPTNVPEPSHEQPPAPPVAPQP